MNCRSDICSPSPLNLPQGEGIGERVQRALLPGRGGVPHIFFFPKGVGSGDPSRLHLAIRYARDAKLRGTFMDVVERIAEFVVGTRFDALPERVRETSKWTILD